MRLVVVDEVHHYTPHGDRHCEYHEQSTDETLLFIGHRVVELKLDDHDRQHDDQGNRVAGDQ